MPLRTSVLGWESVLLYHYSKDVHGDILAGPHPTNDNSHKPGGLWLSDDTDYGWRRFVEERYRNGEPDWQDAPEILRVRYTLLLQQPDHVLTLPTVKDMVDFVDKYGQPPGHCEQGYGVHIDWGRVKAQYDGILITPFHRPLARQHPAFHWYQFDCASGCFWDKSCLSLLRVAEVEDGR